MAAFCAPQEFLILSESRTPPRMSKLQDYSAGSLGSPTIRVDVLSRGEVWKYYWVMLIVRDDSGIAERRGLGKIYQAALDFCCEPGPEWQEIILG